MLFIAIILLSQWPYHQAYRVRYNDQAHDNYMTTQTTTGVLRGEVIDVFEFWNIKIARFLGIPYAAPPVGSLRFKKPSPPKAWSGTRDALEFGNECLQRDVPIIHFNNTEAPIPKNRSEDCLYLNVYAPVSSNEANMNAVPGKDNDSDNSTKFIARGSGNSAHQGNSTHSASSAHSGNSAPLPVMVWIHGGGFTIGAGSQYDARYLAAKGVVVVTINYRLDVFGFLSTEDDVMPGNYGMLDQIAALKWVHDNIAKFGGDPGKVTIFGESAGGASVSLLMLSPLTQGLFQRAIMESGSSLNPWSVNYPRNRFSHKMGTNLLASMSVKCLGFISNSTGLLQCLQAIPGNELLELSESLLAALTYNIWTPRVDSPDGFLPDSPISLLYQGKYADVDTIRGVNRDEMGFFLPTFPANGSLPVQNARGVFSTVLAQFEGPDMESILALMESSFTSATPSGTIPNQEIMDALSGFMFVGPTATELYFASMKHTFKNHFMYQFVHRPSNTRLPGWTAVHTDELGYVFNVTMGEFTQRRRGPPSDGDVQVSNQMMDMWTNFARDGDPTPVTAMDRSGHDDTPSYLKWPTYSSKAPNYLKIDVVSKVSSLSQKLAEFYVNVLQIMTSSNNSLVD